MNTTRAEERFFESTRGRVVLLLRRERRTVEDLAGQLGLTDNAIRTHLVALERDGLVVQAESKRGGGKPAFTYDLTPDAERLFPKAYGPILQLFLQALGDRVPREDVAESLREVGHRLAKNHVNGDQDISQRLTEAMGLLEHLGGLAEAESTEGGYLIKAYSCPLATAVEGNPDVCLIIETVLSDILGTPVRQNCDQGSAPRCRFEVLAATR